ncbi:MAG TPA: D-alanyl-D-alanine carboxypeptidase family protein [Reyranella sp.]|jgi:D-alanyl-D-alanine carboxypeptidase (penicillin-binding protein 5/6)|nr:D-alanyl-D-alanine carboxypeptidase family protein [Reyranella sp.]
MVMLVSWRIDRLLSLVAVLAMVGVAGLAPPAHAQRQEPAKRTQSTKPAKPKPPTAKQAAAAKLDAAAPSDIGPTTVARYAYMIDMQTGTVLLAKDANKPMAPSSMAKMMTTYLLFEDLAAGKLKPETQFKVSERAYAITRGVHSSTMFLELGAEVSVLDLIQGIIVDSGNDASVAVAEGMAGSEEAFADRMNKKAHELGMTGSVFKNASGWPAEGQYVTAHDLAVLAEHTIKDFPKLYEHYAQREFAYNGITQPNRNLELKTVPGVDGLKTGHTEEGGYGQTTSAIRNGRRLVLVLNGMDSIAERARETARLIEWGFRETSTTTILRAGDVLAEAPVWLGVQDKVPLVVPTAVQITTTAGQSAQPRAVAKFDGPIAAPVVKGTKVGTAVITMPDGRTVEYPLETGADVAKLGIVRRLMTTARHYLVGWLS